MGVDEALLPATETDGWRLFWLMAATELDPDEDSRTLADALTRSSGLAATGAPAHRRTGCSGAGRAGVQRRDEPLPARR